MYSVINIYVKIFWIYIKITQSIYGIGQENGLVIVQIFGIVFIGPKNFHVYLSITEK